MTIKLLLSIGLFLIIAYASTQRGKSPLVSVFTLFCAAAAIYFVWAPETANRIAHYLGVGRGADLIFYCWVLISFAVLLNLHFKMRKRDEQMTTIARGLAILEAEARLQRLPPPAHMTLHAME